MIVYVQTHKIIQLSAVEKHSAENNVVVVHKYSHYVICIFSHVNSSGCLKSYSVHFYVSKNSVHT